MALIDHAALGKDSGGGTSLHQRLIDNGITDFFFSREDYSERLDVFLQKAQRSIEVVAVTFQLASDKGDLHSVFKEKLRHIAHFHVCLSLLAPQSEATTVLAKELALDPAELSSELQSALHKLIVFRQQLVMVERNRFDLKLHDSLPFGSAYLLDASQRSGIIHVETKLHGAPRKESFGYQVSGPSKFYERNLLAWRAILDDSRSLD